MAAIFGEGKIFGKLQRLHSLDTLWVENFDEITLSRTGYLGDRSKLVFCHFWQKFSKIPKNGRHFWGFSKIFCQNWQILHSLDILNRADRAISTKSLYLARLRRSEANLCFTIFGKNFRKFPKMAAILNFRIFAKNGKTQIASISLTVRDRAISSKFSTHRVSKQISVCNFGQKIFPSPKMAAILNFRIFAQNGKTLICLDTP